MWEFLSANWGEIAVAVMALLGTITALTETKADDRILDILRRILQAVILGKTK